MLESRRKINVNLMLSDAERQRAEQLRELYGCTSYAQVLRQALLDVWDVRRKDLEAFKAAKSAQ
jgi:hypothetical protein